MYHIFKPKVYEKSEQLQLQLTKIALTSQSDLQDVFEIPPGENLDDWVCYNFTEFFDQLKYLISADQCTCDRFYLGKAVLLCDSPSAQVQSILAQIAAFIQQLPSIDQQYAKDFNATLQKHVSQMVQIYLHLVYKHPSDLVQRSFWNFFNFFNQFQLIKKDELVLCEEVINALQ
ncbi:Mob1-like_protein [Hexamita inflata]|uniref:Mob1-like protein n=1 Tax=Hexamita inflata TaxID=28002 RepID=A0AA86QA60_9EUKA|nr:Mob1-like protein [Hexamita inflata]